MSKITVTTIAGLTSGGDANKVKIESGDDLEVVSGDLTVDTNVLKVDSSNNKVGIGTTSPEETLEVVHPTAPAIQLNRTNDGGFKSIIRQQGNDTEFRGSSGSTKIYTGAADGDSSTARLIIDADGHTTMPTQPAFQANLTSAFSNFAVNTDNTVPFATERFDQNADYNNSTYIFTAPVTGKYQLNVHLLIEDVQNTPTYYQLKLVTSNKIYYETFDPRGLDQNTSYYCLQSSPLADMDASDTAIVYIYQAGGNATSDINGTTALFNGYLVC